MERPQLSKRLEGCLHLWKSPQEVGLALKLGCSELCGWELESGGTLKGGGSRILSGTHRHTDTQRKDLIPNLVWALGQSLGLS